MAMSISTNTVEPADASVNGKQSLLFTSGNNELRASGNLQRISVPAKGGEDPNSALQMAITNAFQEVKSRKSSKAIVIGAIPFDLSEPSCLYVSEDYEWHQRPATSVNHDPMPQLVEQRSIPDEDGFKKAVRHAIVNFQYSDVRKAVLSVMRELRFSSSVDVDQILYSLGSQNKQGYKFQIPLPNGSQLIGVSPELLIRKTGDTIISNPLAGSAKRKADVAADKAAAKLLGRSPKDLYEHKLVVDDIRHLLEPLCVQLDAPGEPSLLSTSALWHLSTRINGKLKDPSISALQLACMLHPTPAVCGFPTDRAHQLIQFIEPFHRGLFTGIVGWCDSDGNGEWVVTIRSGIVEKDIIRVYAGAGIVEASQPESEWAEVQTKLTTMLNACGLAA